MAIFTTKWTFLAQDKFSAVSNRINYSVNRLSGAFTNLNSRIAFTEKSLQSLRTQSSQIRGELFQSLFTGLAFAAPIRSAVRFEDSLAGIKKAVDDITPKQLDEFSKTALKLSESIPIAAAGIVDIATQGAKLGIPLPDLDKFAKLASKTAVALDIDNLTQVGSDLGNLKNIFSLNISELESFLDSVDTFDNKINTTGDIIIRSLVNKGARGARAMGLTNDQTIALVATLDSFGIRAERVGRGVLSMANSLASSKVRKSLNFETIELLQKDPQKGLEKILKSLSKLSAEAKVATIQDMFGRDFSDVVLTLVNNFDKYQKNLTLVADKTSVAGALNREFNLKMETTSANLKTLGNRFNEVGISIGGAFLPALNIIVDIINPIISSISSITNQFPKLTASILGLVGAAFGLRIIRLILKLIKVEALTLIAAFNVWGTVLAGIGIAFVYAYNKFKPFHDAVISVKNFFVNILDIVKKIGTEIASIFSSGNNTINMVQQANATPTMSLVQAANQKMNGSLNININDPGNNVGLVQGASSNLDLRVGRNNPGALTGGIFGGTLAGVN